MKLKEILRKDINIDSIDKFSPFRLLLVSLVSAIFIIYPNITFFSFERNYLGEAKYAAHLFFFVFRYVFFSILIWTLLRHNLLKINNSDFRKRLFQTFLVTGIGYLIYICFSLLLNPKKEWFSGVLLFQFLVIFIFCTLIGHLSHLYSEHRRREQEIEQLKVENLQSRYDALTNQINPHFFFNSLNGLTSLIRKKNDEDTLNYVNKLSDVFRYILQSDKKIMVRLEEELEFVKAFSYMMELRFASKLIFNINVEEDKKNLKIPVLSLLPLIENVAMHNTIDSEHRMNVNIFLNPDLELVISNLIFPKIDPKNSNGTGIKNLENRFQLMMKKSIRIEDDGKMFSVFLPLKPEQDENINS